MKARRKQFSLGSLMALVAMAALPLSVPKDYRYGLGFLALGIIAICLFFLVMFLVGFYVSFIAFKLASMVRQSIGVQSPKTSP